jgi:hypothetical protein
LSTPILQDSAQSGNIFTVVSRLGGTIFHAASFLGKTGGHFALMAMTLPAFK